MATLETVTFCLKAAKFAYDVAQTVKANKAKCKQLAEHLLSLTESLEQPNFKKAVQELDKEPKCLEVSKNAIERAQKFIDSYGKKHKAIKLFTYYKIQESFDCAEKSLSMSFHSLSFFLQSQSYATISKATSLSSSSPYPHQTTHHYQSSPQISHQKVTQPSMFSSPEKGLPHSKSDPSSAYEKRKQAALKELKKPTSLLSNLNLQKVKLADMKSELEENEYEGLIVFWVDPHPENNYPMVTKANMASENSIYITLSSTGELVDVLLSLRPLLNKKDDLRIRVVSNSSQLPFGETNEEKRNRNAWQDVSSMTELFLGTKIPLLVFSSKQLSAGETQNYSNNSSIVVRNEGGLPWFGNVVDNDNLHRFLTFATVFILWRDPSEEINGIVKSFSDQGIVTVFLESKDIDSVFTGRSYLKSAPIAIMCNRHVSTDVRKIKSHIPHAGVHVYTADSVKGQAESNFYDILDNGGVYTAAEPLKVSILSCLQKRWDNKD